MKLLVAVEQRFLGQSNHVFVTGPADHAFWARYREVFEEGVVLARVQPVTGLPGEARQADGPGISFFPLPDYQGPSGYLRRLPELRRRVREAVCACDAYILRVPGLVGRLAWHEIRRLRRPYAVSVVGDPWEALAPGSARTFFRPLYRIMMAANLRRICRGAAAIRYVSHLVLPERYPAPESAFTTSYSDVDLQDARIGWEALEERIRRAAKRSQSGQPLRLGFVGSLAQMYKGPDVLLHALAGCVKAGLAYEAEFVGDGRHQTELEALAHRLGLSGRARFLKALPYGRAVYQFLDSVDLFVMPSRTEGLPRAMLEAMARGCPCIGSAVGGIPELLPPEDMVPPNNPAALAQKIQEVAHSPERMARMARRNWEKASEYSPENLDAKRREFYQAVRLITEQDMKRRGQAN